MILQCPDLTSGPVVDVEDLEPLRALARSQKTERKISAHSRRIARTGKDVPAALSAAFVIQVKHRPYGRLFIIKACPYCERPDKTSHITEGSWVLRCKRESCDAHGGIRHQDWTSKVDERLRAALRAHIQEDVQRTRMEANLPLRLPGDPDYVVTDYEEGSRIIEQELRRFHLEGLEVRSTGAKASDRALFVGADCGTGKTLAASRFADRYDAVFSTLQYSLLDTFIGGKPYQIQGVRKGCKITGLGEVAAARGVSRSFLCHQEGKECKHLASCLAQPRIESRKTPTCVIAALPSLSFGAVVRDGEVLTKEELGDPIANNRLLVVDEAPTPFEEIICTVQQVREASDSDRLSDLTSRARGREFSECEDALLRLGALDCLFALMARPQRSSRRGTDRASDHGGSRREVAELIRHMLSRAEDYEDLKRLRDLFRIGMVADNTKPSGERPCIPEQRDWTVYKRPRDHQSPDAVRELIPKPVVDTCRAIARVLDEEDSPTHKLVAADRRGGALLTLRPRSLLLPESTGTAVMTAGLPVHLRLYRALHPRTEIRTLWIELDPQSCITRCLHLTSSFLRGRSRRAFPEESAPGASGGNQPGGASGTHGRGSKARTEFLGSLARLLRETSARAAELQERGELSQERLRTLIVAQSEVVGWLTMTDAGKAWISSHVQHPLSVTLGKPWHAEPEEWGDVVYFGGRGRGENLWRDCRVAITVGDPLPTPGDMRVRWGDVVDRETGDLFDSEQVGVWLAQETVMQAHGRTRPGRAGMPSLLVHAGRYLPMGFSESDEVVYAEGTRVQSQRERTRQTVLDALGRDGADPTGRNRGTVSRAAELTGLDRKTVAKYVDEESSDTLQALSELARVRESAPIIFKGEFPELARLQEVALRHLRAALTRGTSLPKASTLLALLSQVEGAHQPALRTAQDHLRKLRRELEGTDPIDVPKRRDTREARAAVLLAALMHTGLHAAPEETGSDPAEASGRVR